MGEALGLDEGVAVGVLDGEEVGELEGDALGEAVGPAEGAMEIVGSNDGVLEGLNSAKEWNRRTKGEATCKEQI